MNSDLYDAVIALHSMLAQHSKNIIWESLIAHSTCQWLIMLIVDYYLLPYLH